jgi:hypothetical protein
MMRGRICLVILVVGLLAASAAGAASARVLPAIRSPSGNIDCVFLPGRPAQLLCGIRRAVYAQALQDRCIATDSLDWHGFELLPYRKGASVCAGGILINPTDHPRYVTLAYGKTWSRGPFTCYSRVDGLSCGNHTGHGLFLSREAWRRW